LSYTLKVVGMTGFEPRGPVRDRATRGAEAQRQSAVRSGGGRDACSQSRWGTGLPNIPIMVPRVGIEPTARPAQGFYRPRRPLGCSSA